MIIIHNNILNLFISPQKQNLEIYKKVVLEWSKMVKNIKTSEKVRLFV